MDHVITNAATGEVTIVPFTPEEKAAHIEKSTIRAWEKLRERRNTLLEKSDFSVLPDRWSTYTSEQQSIWAAYRQALRDLPNNTIDPFNVIWPDTP